MSTLPRARAIPLPLIVAPSSRRLRAPAARGRIPRIPAGRGDDGQGRAENASRHLRVRRPDHGLEGSRGARAGHRHPREEALPGRRAGQGGPGAVRHRPQAAGGADRGARSRCDARAGAEGAGRARSRAPEAARRTPRGRPEGSRRRDLQRRARRGAAQGRRGEARGDQAQSRVHERQGADHRAVEPRAQVRRQPRHRQRDAADDDLAGRPDVDPVLRSPRTSSC